MANGVRRRAVLAGGAAIAAAAVGGRTFLQSRELSARRAAERAPLPDAPSLSDLVRYASLAPNSHNTQAWRFVPGGGGMTILPDLSRRTPVVDPDDHHLYASLGAAAETLSIAARARGLGGAVSVETGAEGPVLKVELAGGAPEAGAMFDAIPLRQTTRTIYDGAPLPPGLADELLAEVRAAGAEALWLPPETVTGVFSQLSATAVTAQFESPRYLAELKSWLRFSRDAALRTGDGLYAAALGSPVVPDLIGPLAFDATVDSLAEADRLVIEIGSSSGIAVIVAPTDTPAGWIAAGRAAQRFMLLATASGLHCAYVNAALEQPDLRAEMAALLAIAAGRPSLALRIGHGESLPFSLRRPVAEVLSL
jgi:nitroreductase